MTMISLLLLVEDDAAVRELLSEELSESGFQVRAESGGAQAMAALEEDSARFSAVITDIRLGPGPDGWEIGRRARELSSDMAIVYMSGDSSHEWSASGVPNSVIVAKPFVPAQILTAVTMMLNEAAMRKSGS